MEQRHGESSILEHLLGMNKILLLRRIAGAAAMLGGALALFIHGPTLLL